MDWYQIQPGSSPELASSWLKSGYTGVLAHIMTKYSF
jgi:hypothetical protein